MRRRSIHYLSTSLTLIVGACAWGEVEPEAARIVREAEAAVLGASTVYLETTTSSTSPRFFGGRAADPVVHWKAWYAGPKYKTQFLGHPDGANNEFTCDGQRLLEFFPHLKSYWIRPATKPDLPRIYHRIVGLAAADLTAQPDVIDLRDVGTETWTENRRDTCDWKLVMHRRAPGWTRSGISGSATQPRRCLCGRPPRKPCTPPTGQKSRQ